MVVALSLRSNIPYTTWLEQPPGILETALMIYEEADKE